MKTLTFLLLGSIPFILISCNNPDDTLKVQSTGAVMDNSEDKKIDKPFTSEASINGGVNEFTLTGIIR